MIFILFFCSDNRKILIDENEQIQLIMIINNDSKYLIYFLVRQITEK